MSSGPKKHLKMLQRRADHLEKRINTNPVSLTYDKAELAALRWAIVRCSREETDGQE